VAETATKPSLALLQKQSPGGATCRALSGPSEISDNSAVWAADAQHLLDMSPSISYRFAAIGAIP